MKLDSKDIFYIFNWKDHLHKHSVYVCFLSKVCFFNLRVFTKISFTYSLHIIQTVTLLGSMVRSPLDGVSLTAFLNAVWNVLASVVPDWTAARNAVMTLPELCRFRNNHSTTRSLHTGRHVFSLHTSNLFNHYSIPQ